MNTNKLAYLLSRIGLFVKEVKPDVFKGNSYNIKQWPTFRIWVNKSRRVTIRTHNVQRSFDIRNKKQLERALKGFEIV